MPVPRQPGTTAGADRPRSPALSGTGKPRPQTTPHTHSDSTASSLPCSPTHTASLSLQLLLVGALLVGTLLALLPAAGHDQLWFLLMAHRWLGGATLYGPQLFDSNTPAVIWLSALPDLLARALHLPALYVPGLAKLLVLGLDLALALLCGRLLRRLAPGLRSTHLLWLASAFTLLTLAAPARDFGQRDALTAVLLLPYLLAAAAPRRALPALSPLRLAAALLAALGLCLKPQQALVPLLIEPALLLLSLRPSPHPPNTAIPTEQNPPQNTVTSTAPTPPQTAVISTAPTPPQTAVISTGAKRSGETPVFPPHSQNNTPPRHTKTTLHSDDRPLSLLRRPEPAILLASGLLFIAALHHLTPLFFTLTLPILLDTYWAIGSLSPVQLLAQSPQLTILALLSLGLFLASNHRSTLRPRDSAAHHAAALQADLRRPTLLLLLAGLAATAAFYTQGTGWYYQQLPALTFFGSALALTLIPMAAPLRPPLWLPRATAGLVTLSLALTVVFGGLPLRRSTAYTTPVPDPTLFHSLPPHTPVAILTTSVEDSMMPVVRYDLTWAQRTNNLWLLPAILRNLDPLHPSPPRHRLSPARLAELSALQRRWMLEDLLRWHPTLLLVERCQLHPCQELGPLRPNLLAFFLADPAFRTLFTTHYRPLRETPDYTAYTLAIPF